MYFMVLWSVHNYFFEDILCIKLVFYTWSIMSGMLASNGLREDRLGFKWGFRGIMNDIKLRADRMGFK